MGPLTNLISGNPGGFGRAILRLSRVVAAKPSRPADRSSGRSTRDHSRARGVPARGLIFSAGCPRRRNGAHRAIGSTHGPARQSTMRSMGRRHSYSYDIGGKCAGVFLSVMAGQSLNDQQLEMVGKGFPLPRTGHVRREVVTYARFALEVNLVRALHARRACGKGGSVSVRRNPGQYSGCRHDRQGAGDGPTFRKWSAREPTLTSATRGGTTLTIMRMAVTTETATLRHSR